MSYHHTQLEDNINDMARMFEAKMAEFQAELTLATSSNRKGPTIAALSTEFLAFKSFVCNGLVVLRAEFDALKNNIDRIEMRFRSKMLLVHGIPEEPGEDTSARVISNLVNKCKVPSLTASSIAASYRMGKGVKTGKPRPIVVKFNNYNVRETIWINKVALKGSKITLSEFLTKPRHEVFMAARQKFGISNCWTLDGVIRIKTPDGKIIKVETMAKFNSISSSTENE